MPRTKLFRAGCYLAVLADEDDHFWLCCTKTDVYLENDFFSVVWMETVEGGNNNLYEKMVVKDRINLESVVSKVTIIREKGDDGKIVFRLPEKESIRIKKIIEKVENGSKIHAYFSAFDVKSAIKMDDEDEPLIGRKRKVDQKIKNESSKKKSIKKKKEIKEQSVKAKKFKIDKSDPNWRLKPNHNVTVLEKDPLFESDEDVQFVSSIAHSKLAIRAVLLKDMNMLKTVVNDVKQVHNPNVVRSLGNPMTATDYALKMENPTAIMILTEKKFKEKKRVGVPVCSLRSSDTGTYNYRYLLFLIPTGAQDVSVCLCVTDRAQDKAQERES